MEPRPKTWISRRHFWAACTGLWLVSPPTYGATDRQAAEKVLRSYHIDAMLGSVYERLEDALTRHQADKGVTETQLRGVALLGKRIYQPQNMLTIVAEAYTKIISAADLRTLLAWQKTPLGMRYGQAQKTFLQTPVAQISAYYQQESPALLRPNRRNALNTYSRALEQDQLHASLEAGAELGVELGLSGYMSPAARENTVKIAAHSQSMKIGFLGKNQGKALSQNFFLLKDMRNDEIDEISKWAMSVAGQNHTRALIKALDATLLAAAKTLRDQVIQAARPSPNGAPAKK